MTPDVARLREMRKQFGDRTYMQTGVFERPTMRDMADVLDALIDILAPSPPDGAAEREAPDDLDAHPFIEPVSRLHAEAMRRLGREKEAGDALRIKHAEGWIDALGHAIGMLKLTAMDKPTPAPTEAPAAGDGEAAIATRMALCREFVAQQSASSEWKDGAATGFYAGWNAALAAALADQPMSDDQHIEAYHEAYERGRREALAARPAAVTDAMVEAAASAYFGVDNWKSFPAPTVTSYREAWRSALTAALAARGPA